MKKRLIGVGLVLFLCILLVPLLTSSQTCVLKKEPGIKCLEITRAHPDILADPTLTPEDVCESYPSSSVDGSPLFFENYYFETNPSKVIQDKDMGNTDAKKIYDICYSGCCKCNNSQDVIERCYSDFSRELCDERCKSELGSQYKTFDFDEDTIVCPLDCETKGAAFDVSGIVRYPSNNTGMKGVLVTITDSGIADVTDGQGQYSFEDVPVGDHLLTAEKHPYSGELSITVEDQPLQDQDIKLQMDYLGAVFVKVQVEKIGGNKKPLDGATAIFSYGTGQSFKCTTAESDESSAEYAECWIDIISGDTSLVDEEKTVLVGKDGYSLYKQSVKLSDNEDNIAIVTVTLDELNTASLNGNVEFFGGDPPDSFTVSLTYPLDFVAVGYQPLTKTVTAGNSFSFDDLFYSSQKPINVTVTVSAPNYYTNTTEVTLDEKFVSAGTITLTSGDVCDDGTLVGNCKIPLNGYICKMVQGSAQLLQDCRGMDETLNTPDDCCPEGTMCEDQGTVGGQQIFGCVPITEAGVCESDCTFVGDKICHAECNGTIGSDGGKCIFDTEFAYCEVTNEISENYLASAAVCFSGWITPISYLDGKPQGFHSVSESFVIEGCEGKFAEKAEVESKEICDNVEYFGNVIQPKDDDDADDYGANCMNPKCNVKSCIIIDETDGQYVLSSGICRNTTTPGAYYSGECSSSCEYLKCQGNLSAQPPWGNIEGPCMCGNKFLNFKSTASSLQGKAFCLAGYDNEDGTQGFITSNQQECLGKLEGNYCYQEGFSCCAFGCENPADIRSYDYFVSEGNLNHDYQSIFSDNNILHPCGKPGELYMGQCCDGPCVERFPAEQCCSSDIECPPGELYGEEGERGLMGCSDESYACKVPCEINFPDCKVDVKVMTVAGEQVYLKGQEYVGDQYNIDPNFVDPIPFHYSAHPADPTTRACKCGGVSYSTEPDQTDKDDIRGVCCPTEDGIGSYAVLERKDGEFKCTQYPVSATIEGVVIAYDYDDNGKPTKEMGPLPGANIVFTNMDTGSTYLTKVPEQGQRYQITLSEGLYEAVAYAQGYENSEPRYVEISDNGGVAVVQGKILDGSEFFDDLDYSTPDAFNLEVVKKYFECDLKKVTNLNATAVKGERAVVLNWTPACYGYPVAYYILTRVCGDETYTGIKIPVSKIVQVNQDQFYFVDDGSVPALPAPEWDTECTYTLKKYYTQPGEGGKQYSESATVDFTMGNWQCSGKTNPNVKNDQFCFDNKREVCTNDNFMASTVVMLGEYGAETFETSNNLDVNGNGEIDDDEKGILDSAWPQDCGDEMKCVAISGKTFCRNLGKCATEKQDGNVFALFSDRERCLGLKEGVPNNLCVYDYTHSTRDDCFSCYKKENKKVMRPDQQSFYANSDDLDPVNCYDYNSKSACELDSCGAGVYVDEETETSEVVNCTWYNTTSFEFGKGICYPASKENPDYAYIKNEDFEDEIFGYKYKDTASNEIVHPSTCSLCDKRLQPFSNIDCTQDVCDKLGDCFSVVSDILEAPSNAAVSGEGVQSLTSNTQRVYTCSLDGSCSTVQDNIDACKCSFVAHLADAMYELMKDASNNGVTTPDVDDYDTYSKYLKVKFKDAGCVLGGTNFLLGSKESSSVYTTNQMWDDIKDRLDLQTLDVLEEQCQKFILDEFDDEFDACVTMVTNKGIVDDDTLPDLVLPLCLGEGYNFDEGDLYAFNTAVQENLDNYESQFEEQKIEMSYCESCGSPNLGGMCSKYSSQQACEGVDSLQIDYVNETVYGDVVELNMSDFEYQGYGIEDAEDVLITKKMIEEEVQNANEQCSESKNVVIGFADPDISLFNTVLSQIDTLTTNRDIFIEQSKAAQANFNSNLSALNKALDDNQTYWNNGGDPLVLEQLRINNETYHDKCDASCGVNDFTCMTQRAEDCLRADQANEAYKQGLYYKENMHKANKNASDAWKKFNIANENFQNVKTNLIDTKANLSDRQQDRDDMILANPQLELYYEAREKKEKDCAIAASWENLSSQLLNASRMIALEDYPVSFWTNIKVDGKHRYKITFLAMASEENTPVEVTINGHKANPVRIRSTDLMERYEVVPYLTTGLGQYDAEQELELRFTFAKQSVLTVNNVTVQPVSIVGLRFPSDDACGFGSCKWNDTLRFCFKDGNDDDRPDCDVPKNVLKTLDSEDDAPVPNYPDISEDDGSCSGGEDCTWKQCKNTNNPPIVIDNIQNPIVGADGMDLKFYSVSQDQIDANTRDQLITDIKGGTEPKGTPIRELWYCIDKYDMCDPFVPIDFDADDHRDFYFKRDTPKTVLPGENDNNLFGEYIDYLKLQKGGELTVEDATTYYLRYVALDKFYNLMPLQSTQVYIDLLPPRPKLTFYDTEDQRTFTETNNISFRIDTEIDDDYFMCSVNLSDGINPDVEGDGLSKDDAVVIDSEGQSFVNVFTDLDEGYYEVKLKCWDDAGNVNNTKYLIYVDTNTLINIVYPAFEETIGPRTQQGLTDFFIVLTTTSNSTCSYRGTPFSEMPVGDDPATGVIEGSHTHLSGPGGWLAMLNWDIRFNPDTNDFEPVGLVHPVTEEVIGIDSAHLDYDNYIKKNINVENGGFIHMMHSSQLNALLMDNEQGGFVEESRYYPPLGASGLADIVCTDRETGTVDKAKLVFTYDASGPLSTITVKGLPEEVYPGSEFSMKNQGSPSWTTWNRVFTKAPATVSFSCEDGSIANIDGTDSTEITFGCARELMNPRVGTGLYPEYSCASYINGDFSDTEINNWRSLSDGDVIATNSLIVFKADDHGSNPERGACLEVVYDSIGPGLKVSHTTFDNVQTYRTVDVTNKDSTDVEFEIWDYHPEYFNVSIKRAGESFAETLLDLPIIDAANPENSVPVEALTNQGPAKYGFFNLALNTGYNAITGTLIDKTGVVNVTTLDMYYDNYPPVVDDIFLRDLTADDDEVSCQPDRNSCGGQIEYGHPFEVIVPVVDENYTGRDDFVRFEQDNTVWVSVSDEEEKDMLDEQCYVANSDQQCISFGDYTDGMIELDYVSDDLYRPLDLGPFNNETMYLLRPLLFESGELFAKEYEMPAVEELYEPEFDKTIYKYPWMAGTYAVEIEAEDYFGIKTTEVSEDKKTLQYFDVVDTVPPEFKIIVNRFADNGPVVFDLLGDKLVPGNTYEFVVVADDFLNLDDNMPVLSITGSEGFSGFTANLQPNHCEKNRCRYTFSATPPQVPVSYLNQVGTLTLSFTGEDINGVENTATLENVLIDTMGYDPDMALPWMVGVPRQLDAPPYYVTNEEDRIVHNDAPFVMVVQGNNITLTGFIPEVEDYYVEFSLASDVVGEPVETLDPVDMKPTPGLCMPNDEALNYPEDVGVAASVVSALGGATLGEYDHESGSTLFGAEYLYDMSYLAEQGCYVRFGHEHEDNDWMRYLISDINFNSGEGYEHWHYGDKSSKYSPDSFSEITLAQPLMDSIAVREDLTFYYNPYPENWFNYTIELHNDTNIIGVKVKDKNSDRFNFFALEVIKLGEFGEFKIRNASPWDVTYSFTGGGNDQFTKTITFEVPIPSDCYLVHNLDTTADDFRIPVTDYVPLDDGWFKYSYTIDSSYCKPTSGGDENQVFYQMGTAEKKSLSLPKNYHFFLVECEPPISGLPKAQDAVCYSFDTLISSKDSITGKYVFTGKPDICPATSPSEITIGECKKDCSTAYSDYDSCMTGDGCMWCPGSVDDFHSRKEGGKCVNSCSDCEVDGRELPNNNRPVSTFLEGIQADDDNKICDDANTCASCDDNNAPAGCLCEETCRISKSGKLYVPPNDENNVNCGGPLQCKTDFPTDDVRDLAEYNEAWHYEINQYDTTTGRDEDYPGYDSYGTKSSWNYYMSTTGVDSRCELCESGGMRYYVNDCGASECPDNIYNNDHKTNTFDVNVGEWIEGNVKTKNKVCDSVPMCPGDGNSVLCSGYEIQVCRCDDKNTRFGGYLINYDTHDFLGTTPKPVPECSDPAFASKPENAAKCIDARYPGKLKNCGGFSGYYSKDQAKKTCEIGSDDCNFCRK